MLNLPITRDGFLWAFSITSQLHHVPLATTLILQKFQPPFTLASFQTAADQCGLKVRQKAVRNTQLLKLQLPCLVTLIPPVEEIPIAVGGDLAIAQHVVLEYQMALLQSMDNERVVLTEACSKSTVTLSREAFEKRFAGEALIISPVTSVDADVWGAGKNTKEPHKSMPELGKSAMSWFIPQSGWFKTILRGMTQLVRNPI